MWTHTEFNNIQYSEEKGVSHVYKDRTKAAHLFEGLKTHCSKQVKNSVQVIQRAPKTSAASLVCLLKTKAWSRRNYARKSKNVITQLPTAEPCIKNP